MCLSKVDSVPRLAPLAKHCVNPPRLRPARRQHQQAHRERQRARREAEAPKQVVKRKRDKVKNRRALPLQEARIFIA